VPGQHFVTILARTDPFDVAQGLERHIRSLSADHIRALISDAQPRMNEWYLAEFTPLLNERDDARVRSGFAHTLKSNLRAIPLFGPAFCEGVIGEIPGDRAVGLGEEHYYPGVRRIPPLAFGAAALALLIAGAAGEHAWNNASANAQTPVVLMTPAPVAPGSPVPRRQMAAAIATPVKTPVKTAAPEPRSTPQPRAPAAAPAPAESQPQAVEPPRATSAPVRRTPVGRPTPPPGKGVATVIAVRQTPEPSPEPSAIDVSDMPQAFTDATPLPRAASAAPAHVAVPLAVATPTPGPNRSWTHRLVHAAVHLVNSTLTTVGISKKAQGPTPTPSPSPSGPKP
jgi:hypothetical protein